MDSNNKKLAASICDFLKQHQSLSTAVEQISSAFKLESDDMRKPVKLVDLFNAHLDTLSNVRNTDSINIDTMIKIFIYMYA